MKKDNETRENLLKSAKKEFMEKGFTSASLRNICKNAGVTTGALYFFFKDKEDLFASLVQEPLDKLVQVMNSHFKDELEQSELNLAKVEDFGDDIEVSKEIVHFMYQYYDEFQLILVKSQGSRFENCIDWFVEVSEKHYRVLADKMTEYMHAPRLDDYMIHWLAHMQVDVFVHLLTHEKTEEEAMKHIEPIIYYIISGWIGLFQR